MDFLKFDKVVLDCPDPASLADFYAKLLGWAKRYDTGDFVIIGSGTGGVDIGFQKNADYVNPVWPEAAGAQQQMLHLDFAVPAVEYECWIRRAESYGAKKAAPQESENWTVMLDPAGHPFCIEAI